VRVEGISKVRPKPLKRRSGLVKLVCGNHVTTAVTISRFVYSRALYCITYSFYIFVYRFVFIVIVRKRLLVKKSVK
jgi:hypothetical protein